MNYDLNEVALMGDLIFNTLTKLIEKGIIDIDICNVNIDSSALRALDKKYLEDDEADWKDDSEAGLIRKGIHYVMCAIFFDGSPVISKDTEIVEPMLVGYFKCKDGK